jgi:hypothetical protein
MNKKYIVTTIMVLIGIALIWNLTESFYCHSLTTTLPLDASPNYVKSDIICTVNSYFVWVGLPAGLLFELLTTYIF